MPDPLHPHYGTNLVVDVEQLRQTIRNEVRRTMHELAPGVDPGLSSTSLWTSPSSNIVGFKWKST